MDHQAVVADRPAEILPVRGHLFAYEAVFRRELVEGKRFLVEKMSEFVGELLPLVVADLEETVLDAKCIVEVLAEIVMGELRRPALQIPSVEQLYPLLFIRVVLCRRRSPLGEHDDGPDAGKHDKDTDESRVTANGMAVHARHHNEGRAAFQ